jgi:8-oxo-dGTP pyrophosphatase MutT (NUDIX family)
MSHFLSADLPLLLQNRLMDTLPGIEAQYRMAPYHRARIDPATLPPGEVLAGAVLILIFSEAENPFIPLIERNTYPGVHSGQVSLPGGKKDRDDASLLDTAVRECFEEIGMSAGIRVLGKLTPLYIPVSKFLVEPYVAVCDVRDPVFVAHEREVKSVIRFTLSDLLNGAVVGRGQISAAPGISVESPYFNVEGRKVWGATAMILNELKEIISTIS